MRNVTFFVDTISFRECRQDVRIKIRTKETREIFFIIYPIFEKIFYVQISISHQEYKLQFSQVVWLIQIRHKLLNCFKSYCYNGHLIFLTIF